MTDLEKEFQKFNEDIEKHVTDPKTSEYIQTRTAKLIKTVLSEIDKLVKYNQEKITSLETKLDKVETIVEGIEKDIYLEDEIEADDIISCPYCNSEIPIDYDENLKEIECPECNNIIELDWNGDVDDDLIGGCSGHCSSCGGCGNDDADEEN